MVERSSFIYLFVLRLTLIGTMFDLLGNSTANACWATGQVKRYYLWVGTIGAFVFLFHGDYLLADFLHIRLI